MHKCDLASGVVELAPFGPSVPKAVQNEVLSLNEKIKSGKLVVFTGPIKDSKGNIRLPAGKRADIEWISKMNFFVPSIEGNLPK
jgi:basic membrane lipoprotein Med (substrate-binding protein (PBP1-ABC) superfamily)